MQIYQSNLPSEYSSPEHLRTVATYLRSADGVKIRSGVEFEKRVDYFKGKRFVECILEAKSWPKSLPRITDKYEAIALGDVMMKALFFHRSEKVDDQKGILKISNKDVFEESGYYTWMYAGNLMWSHFGTGIIVAIVIVFTMLPLWPMFARKALWYLSVTFLIGLTGFCLLRYILFVTLWMFGFEFWLFPRLFDESLAFFDSFKPVYTFESGTPGQMMYRFGTMMAIAGLVYWCSTQPTEFDELMQAQKSFIDDMYAGNLLPDSAQASKDSAMHGLMNKRVPSVHDIINDMDAEERQSITDADGAFADLLSSEESAHGSKASLEDTLEDVDVISMDEYDEEDELEQAEDVL